MRKIKLFIAGMAIAVLPLMAAPDAASAKENDVIGVIEQNVDTIDEANVDTVINLSDGSSNEVDNAVLAESLEEVCESVSDPVDVDNYEVRYEEERILFVEPVGAALSGTYSTTKLNKYYAVTFPLPGTNKECFLTGLTATSVDHICDELIKHYADGTTFVIESLNIIDAEKLYSTRGGDDLLCWAASCSNMLHYTGWGAQAQFNDEDALLKEFAASFIDAGFGPEMGIRWFFSGSTFDAGSNNNIKSYTKSGGFLKQYDVSNLCNLVEVNNHWKEEMPGLINRLKEGYGIELTVGWFYSTGSHAITMWGVIVNNDYTPNEKGYYDTFIVTDSDSNRPETDTKYRGIQLNTFEVYKLSPFEEENASDTFTLYDETGYLMSYVYLAPYSDDIVAETDESATLNWSDTVDLYIQDVLFDNQPGKTGSKDTVYEGNIYIKPVIYNLGDKQINADVHVSAVIKDSSGNIVENADAVKAGVIDTNGSIAFDTVNIENLPAGEYTVELTVNPDKTIPEAMYLNNTYKTGLKVVENKSDFSTFAFGGTVTGKRIDEMNDTFYDIDMSYENILDSWIYKNCDSIKLKARSFDGNQWIDEEDKSIIRNDEASDKILPDKVTICAAVLQWQFVLDIEKDGAHYIIYSSPIVLKHTGVTGFRTENCMQDDTLEIAPTDVVLPDGKYFEFKLANTTDADVDEVSGYYSILCNNVLSGTITLADHVEFNLAKGEESSPVRFNIIEHDEPFLGRYDVGVSIKSFIGDEEFECYVSLGGFCVREPQSSVVNTTVFGDDPYDGTTSLTEAIAYCEAHPGSKVTFSDEAAEMAVSAPIRINGDVTIDGLISHEGQEDSYALLSGGMLYRLFIVEKGGKLTLNNLKIQNTTADDYGGTVLVNGGELYMNSCSITTSNAHLRGGAIYADGGKVMIKDTSMVMCTSGFGGAICIDGDAYAEILNCFITMGISNMGVIYNNSGTCNIINSVIADNRYSGISGKDHGVVSHGDTNIINSVLMNSSKNELNGDIKVFACALDNKDSDFVYDELSVFTGLDSFFNYDTQSERIFFEHAAGKPFTFPSMRKCAEDGVLTSVSGGKIYISKKGKKSATGVKTEFSDYEVKTDILGNERKAVFGCVTKITPNLQECTIEPVKACIYTGKAIKPELVVKCGNKVLKKGTDYSVTYSNNVKVGTAKATIYGLHEYFGQAEVSFEIVNVSVRYRAYVQKKGWMSFVKDGAMAGAKENLRMETIQMKLSGNSNIKGGIKYRAYVQKLGWTFWADTAISDSYAGTKGKSLRIESVQIKGYGDLAEAYDVYYRVYCDKYGWLDWAKNGASAGTSGLAKKLQAFQVKLVAKGGKAPGKTTKPYATNKNP